MTATKTAKTATGKVHRASIDLPAVPPFDFAHSVRFIEGFPAMAGEQLARAGVLVSAVREHGTIAAVRLSALDDGKGLHCELESAQRLTDSVVDAIADRISFYLGLTDDLGEFYRLADNDAAFRKVVARLHGYHQVKFPSPFELLCWAILCQRVPMPVARKMKHAIVEEFGNSIEVDGRLLHAFPDVEQLLGLSEERFHALVGNARKAGYLYAAVRKWAAIDEDFLRTGDYEAVRELLLEIPGIGPWSATFLLIRGLGRMERMAPDREALRAAGKVYGRPIGEDEFCELAARYGKWQGYWGHYLRVGS